MSVNQNVVLAGLSSYSLSIPSDGAYFMEGKLQLPSVRDGDGASEVVVTITNDTDMSTIYTGAAGLDGFYVDFVAEADDVITVALTSSADADAPLNVIKSTIQFGSAQ